MHRGYFALWRKVEDHPFYQEPREFSKFEAWIDILMQAQHDKHPRRVVIGMNVLECKYGECLKSVSTWADRWRWSRSKVFRYLKLLKKMRQIDYKNETVTTRIIVINYELYDPKRNGNETETERERNASETQAVTDKNDKNVKNDNNKTFSSDSDEIRLSKYLFNHILKNNPKAKEPNFKVWAKHIDLAKRIDGRSVDDLKSVIQWCQKDSFWAPNILSTKKLREQFDQLWVKMNQCHSSTGCKRTDANIEAARRFLEDDQ